jgi:hypothetical protein
MALSQAELEQCKFWLGYGNLTALARPYFDIAVVFEDVVQKTLDLTWAEGYVRGTILPNLIAVDAQIQNQVIIQAQATELVGEFKMDSEKAFRALTRLSSYWKNQLALVLKVPRVDSDLNQASSITVF